MKKAIVQNIEGHWHITSIGLDDAEIAELRYQLEASDQDPNYVISIHFEIVYR